MFYKHQIMNIFFQKELNSSLQKNGFVVVSLLNNDEISELEHFFYSSESEFQNKFTTYACNNIQYKKDVDNLLKKVIGKKLERIITPEMIPFWGNFMLKKPDENSDMPLHADWQYVDEKKYISLNVWTPFIDTSLENGSLHVVPKSHQHCNYPRGINLPRYYEIKDKEIKTKFGKELKLKKGEAVIYDHRLLHYSYPNKSTKNRLAATLVYVPKDTPISIFYKNNDASETNLLEIEGVSSLINSSFYEEPKNVKNKLQVEIPKMEEVKVFESLCKTKRNSVLLKIDKLFSRF